MGYKILICPVFAHESCEKSFVLILPPTNDTRVCPTTLYSKVISFTEMSKNPSSVLRIGKYLYKKLQ